MYTSPDTNTGYIYTFVTIITIFKVHYWKKSISNDFLFEGLSFIGYFFSQILIVFLTMKINTMEIFTIGYAAHLLLSYNASAHAIS